MARLKRVVGGLENLLHCKYEARKLPLAVHLTKPCHQSSISDRTPYAVDDKKLETR